MAREINAKIAKEFADQCYSAAYKVLTAWVDDDSFRCYWDNSPYAIKQFVLEARHKWGTAYCYWDSDTKTDLTRELRNLGAANIKMKVEWNRVVCTFDMKLSKQLALEKTMKGD